MTITVNVLNVYVVKFENNVFQCVPLLIIIKYIISLIKYIVLSKKTSIKCVSNMTSLLLKALLSV